MNATLQPVSTSSLLNETVVVKLWEVYLLYHPADLYKKLTDNSLGNGPEHDSNMAGRIIFKFTSHAWESEIRPLLYEFRIPVSIQSNRLGAVRTKGRTPVLR